MIALLLGAALFFEEDRWSDVAMRIDCDSSASCGVDDIEQHVRQSCTPLKQDCLPSSFVCASWNGEPGCLGFAVGVDGGTGAEREEPESLFMVFYWPERSNRLTVVDVTDSLPTDE